ncbi:PDZ domain-containing protein [Dysgonomonas sp. Marseille-P4677]|uniref:PDZ domain-containing protein n=1 Tax=Dysgonomonas sp. Marseille-P4677 TaxID=2364790 RepID=UPI00191410BE|nr:PDZ domain-containing protein [Dysgonomonas sp. Marseille-P4677]MBK5720301.1 PDZ domain-containing protein [Dysgonomonas sp. Marseille-P4677]
MRILLICLLLLILTPDIKSQNYDKNCYFGFTFEVSENTNWGYGELVITDVEPGSPAENAGIKVNDIIMEINGKATYLRDNQTIAKWLFEDMYAPTVTFTIRNMNTYFKEYTLYRKCVATNSVSEKELSEIFAFYSLENTNQRAFSLPLHVEPNKDVDFADYHTYDFYKDNKPVPAIDAQIIALLEKDLQAKGLVRDTSDPDIVVQAYYNYESNPQFTGLDRPNSTQNIWRYDSDKLQMVPLPILKSNEPNINKSAQYIVEYGFSFYDRKYIDTKKLTQIWDCNIKDYLSSKYALEEYVRIHTPLMLKQFPYSTKKEKAYYKVNFNRFNYTGMYFDADNLTTIKDVDMDSPAYRSGIRPGYIIKKINGKKFEHSKESLSEGYKRFIYETMVFRDQSTRFTNAEGFTDCMFWNVGYYNDISKELNKSQYMSHFSYLYGFENYINSKNDNKIVLEVWDGMQTRIFSITPDIHKSVVIKIL